MNDLDREFDEWLAAYFKEKDPRFDWVVTTQADQDADPHPEQRVVPLRPATQEAPGQRRAA